MMEASILDLRYRMREVLDALDRRTTVLIRYHGKVKGRIVPHGAPQRGGTVADHPFFGMLKGDERLVRDVMQDLRKSRYSDEAV